MTDKQTYNIGLVLIALGALVFLGNFGLFNGMPGIIGSLVLGAIGVLFSRTYFTNTRHIWALLIGFGFFAAAAAAITGELAGAYFLAILGSGFAFTYFQNRRHWWAIIPAGVLGTLALIVGIETRLPIFEWATGTVFFLGIAATFAVLHFLPELKKRWAIYPSLGALILAFLSSSFTGSWIMPLVLIAAGIYFLKNKAALNLSFGNNATNTEPVAPKTEFKASEERLETNEASL